jgi:hypothetical protein
MACNAALDVECRIWFSQVVKKLLALHAAGAGQI